MEFNDSNSFFFSDFEVEKLCVFFCRLAEGCAGMQHILPMRLEWNWES